MTPNGENALTVQSDNTVLLEVHAPRAEAARMAIAAFAELLKSPEHVHTYRLTPLSIWNARSMGVSDASMVAALREHARYPVPENVVAQVLDLAARYGRVVLTKDGDALVCACLDRPTAERLARDKSAGAYLADRLDATRFRVPPAMRGVLKQALVAAGFPAEDLAGYVAGDVIEVFLRERCLTGAAFAVRDYQREAAEAFHLAGSERRRQRRRASLQGGKDHRRPGGHGGDRTDDPHSGHQYHLSEAVAPGNPRQDDPFRG